MRRRSLAIRCWIFALVMAGGASGAGCWIESWGHRLVEAADAGPSHASGADKKQETDPEDFVSYDPYANPGGSSHGYGDSDAGASGYDGGSSDAGASSDSGAAYDSGSSSGEGEEDPGREIAEADIVRVLGDRLYALSAYRGLLVADVSDPDHLQLLGRYPCAGVPFEMYLRDGLAHVMYSAFWTYAEDPSYGGYSWQTTSRLLILELSDPAAIRPIGEYDLAGEISDSRLVGDVLYAVTYENGWCWGCDVSARTVVTSLAVADPTDIHIADRVSFSSDAYSWGPRHIAVTTERMYVAGEEYEGDYGTSRSVLQVVDISDPTGVLRLGARVPVAGQIASRWQMNEQGDVLRVISQPWSWWTDARPMVETFAVADADTITPLGSLRLETPPNERLMSVQFDGPRAFAVTFRNTDPLFLIDLSDPAHPVQRGEVQMPGWLYHMVPAGERLFAIGYGDRGEGLAVSLFDVADLDNPTLLDRVTFGGDWGYMPEDQDRIHKAFQILPELNLILMPFSGWSYEAGYRSGIQLIDLEDNALLKRGVAPHKGQARRALIHDGRLLALSDDRLDSFDIANRDRPVRTSTLALARNVQQVAPVGAHLAELVSDWWSGEASLEIVPADDPNAAQPVGSLDLSSLRPAGADAYSYWYYDFAYASAHLHVDGSLVHLIFTVWDDAAYDERTRVATIDVEDPAAPRLRSLFTLAMAPGYGAYDTVWNGDAVVQHGSALAMLSGRDWIWDDARGQYRVTDSELLVYDLSAAEGPHLSGTFTLQPDNGPLQLHGSTVYTVHREVVPEQPQYVRYFLDRVDIADPAAPVRLDPINIPGALVGAGDDGQVATIGWDAQVSGATDWESCCDSRYAYRCTYDWDTGTCTRSWSRIDFFSITEGQVTQRQRLRLGTQPYEAVFTGDRLIAQGYAEDSGAEALKIFAPDSLGTWHHTSTYRLPASYQRLQIASGHLAVLRGDYPPSLSLVSTDQPDAPQWISSETLPGYAVSSQVFGDSILTTCGPWGVAVTSLAGLESDR